MAPEQVNMRVAHFHVSGPRPVIYKGLLTHSALVATPQLVRLMLVLLVSAQAVGILGLVAAQFAFVGSHALFILILLAFEGSLQLVVYAFVH